MTAHEDELTDEALNLVINFTHGSGSLSREAFAEAEYLAAGLVAMRAEPCRPISWPSNYSYRCQSGHIHQAEKGVIGGDFPL